MNLVYQSSLFRPEDIIKISEINDILSNEYFYEKNKIQLIGDKSSSRYIPSTGIISEIMYVRNSYERGESIKIEGLELWSESIKGLCSEYKSNSVDAHLFISPLKGTSFPMHKDDRDVFIYMLYGSKKFYTENYSYVLKGGDMLSIPSGYLHKAEALSDCISLSLGVPICNTISQDSRFINWNLGFLNESDYYDQI